MTHTLESLKELAAKATPGPWVVDRELSIVAPKAPVLTEGAVRIVIDYIPLHMDDYTRDFIAAFNPQTVQALLANTVALRELVAAAGEVLDAESDDNLREAERHGLKPGTTLIGGRWEVNAAMYRMSHAGTAAKQALVALQAAGVDVGEQLPPKPVCPDCLGAGGVTYGGGEVPEINRPCKCTEVTPAKKVLKCAGCGGTEYIESSTGDTNCVVCDPYDAPTRTER